MFLPDSKKLSFHFKTTENNIRRPDLSMFPADIVLQILVALALNGYSPSEPRIHAVALCPVRCMNALLKVL